ncbi:hypothetical protein GCM10022267_84490 [Lentzea roselyniae]|uniref:Uncharacterized protein n=1 Tax=Lentzea roselyniae TaxID=531940 RepID=A0ABP7C9X5_9PSEU
MVLALPSLLTEVPHTKPSHPGRSEQNGHRREPEQGRGGELFPGQHAGQGVEWNGDTRFATP